MPTSKATLATHAAWQYGELHGGFAENSRAARDARRRLPAGLLERGGVLAALERSRSLSAPGSGALPGRGRRRYQAAGGGFRMTIVRSSTAR
jgi:hypothetical protein